MRLIPAFPLIDDPHQKNLSSIPFRRLGILPVRHGVFGEHVQDGVGAVFIDGRDIGRACRGSIGPVKMRPERAVVC